MGLGWCPRPRSPRWPRCHAREASDGYGLGLITYEVAGHRYVGHTGGMVGYIAGMWSDPAVQLASVVLQSGPGHSPFALTRLAIRALAAVRDGRDPFAMVSSPPGDVDGDRALAAFTGTYTGPDGRSFRTRIASGTLSLGDGGRVIALEHRGDGRFLVPDPCLGPSPSRLRAGWRCRMAWRGPLRPRRGQYLRRR